MRVGTLGTRFVSGAARVIGVLIRPRSPLQIIRHERSAEVIERREIPYWQERGWARRNDTYQGNYQTRFGSFPGLIEDRGFNNLCFYIYEPPPEVRSSGHWPCFQPRFHKGYLVHMAHRPQDVSSGIMTVERLITEAFQGTA